MSPSPTETHSLHDRLGYLLVRAAVGVRQRYAQDLAKAGLLPNEHAILSRLRELGACHQKELAARVVLDPGDIVAYLDNLQDSGLIERDRDPNDRRRHIVSATESGLRVLVEADTSLDQVEAEVFGCLPGADQKRLSRDLKQLIDWLGANTSAGGAAAPPAEKGDPGQGLLT